MVDVTNVLNGHLRQFKDLSLCTVLYPTLGVHNGDANTVCKGERASHFTGRGCFDDLSAGGVMKSVSLVFIPLSKGQFSQHSTYFHVVLNLAWKCLLYSRLEPVELMGNTHLGSCALPSEEVSNGGQECDAGIKGSGFQAPSTNRDSNHHIGIANFQSYLWLPPVAMVPFFSSVEVKYGAVGVSVNLLVVLSSWSQAMGVGGLSLFLY